MNCLDSLTSTSIWPFQSYYTQLERKQLGQYSIAQRFPIQFDRRLTGLQWLANGDSYLAMSSKSGDILLYHLELGDVDGWPTHLPTERRSSTFITASHNRSTSMPVYPMVRGLGAGDSIAAFQFGGLTSPRFIYSASVSGLLQEHDMTGSGSGSDSDIVDTVGLSRILLRTDDAHAHWFTSLALSHPLHLLCVSSTRGEMYFTDLRLSRFNGSGNAGRMGGFGWLQLHKQKIQDLQWMNANGHQNSNPYLLASSANDKTVCIWDWRYIRTAMRDPHATKADSLSDTTKKWPHSCQSQESYRSFTTVQSLPWKGLGSAPLMILPNEGNVTCLEWDPNTNGRLLATCQNSEIKIYDLYRSDCHDLSTRSSSESLEPGILQPMIRIQHPNRHFQHMTSIEASWHTTLPDTFLIGRYPDPHLLPLQREPTKMTKSTQSKYRTTIKDTHATDNDHIPVVNDQDQRNGLLDLKSIDVYDCKSGQLIHQLYDPMVQGIHCLAKMDPTGRVLASTSGSQLYLWKVDANAQIHKDALRNRFASASKSHRGESGSDSESNAGDNEPKRKKAPAVQNKLQIERNKKKR